MTVPGKPLPAGSKPSVLFLLSALIVGGSERKAIRMANALVTRGWNVHIAYLNSHVISPAPLAKEIADGVAVICMERRSRYSLGAAFRLARYIRKERLDCVVSVNLYPLTYMVPIMVMPRISRPRLLVLLNTTFFVRARDARFMHLYKRLINRVDAAIFGCRYQMQRWIGEYGLKPHKVTYLYNGVDLKHFQMEEPPETAAAGTNRGSSGGVTVVGTVGQLRKEKNQRELILATEMLVKAGYGVSVLIAGDGVERDSLERLVRERGLQQVVRFLGEVSQVTPMLARIDVFVLPSSSETFSNAALEAMAMGRAVVLSRVGGAPEMVTEGHNGFLYEPGHPSQLSEILQLLIRNPEKRRGVGINARRTVENRFGFEQMISGLERLLIGYSINSSDRSDMRNFQ